MNVEIVALCDGASVDSSGKLNVFGVFDQITATGQPLTHPQCMVVVRMRFEKIEEGEKSLKIAVVDADGKEVFPTLNSKIQVRVPPNTSTGTLQILLEMRQLTLPHFGEYAIDVAVDGRVVGSTHLFARPIQQQPQGG